MLFLVLKALVITKLMTVSVSTYKCDRIPSDLIVTDQTNANNGKYLLDIEGKPEMYTPNERYQITLKVDSYVYINYKFKKFIITMQSRVSPNDDENVVYQTGNFILGNDMLSRFSITCKDTVVEANTQPKKQITLTWKAPPANSGCVSIKATVIETRERWYADDEATLEGFLTKTVCENVNENEDELPEILDYCCSCDEAKYEMAFQGNWIRNTHPKGFPEDLWTTKFSDLIGASHKNNQAFWKDNTEPSVGLKELAFNGSSKTLESELMGNAGNLRTIIKARGLSYPNITSSSYSIFRVDNENHLVSVVTKMIPSPDWIIGVSNMELCLSNCSWKQSRTINLYPRDVGIDDALEYTEHEPSTNSKPVVTLITSSDPDDPRSPFYNENGEKMEPIAKLHFKLEKIYKKECDPNRRAPEPQEKENFDSDQIRPNDHSESRSIYRPMPSNYRPTSPYRYNAYGCQTIGWSKWSSCSVECGKGHMTRNVRFKHEPSPGSCLDIVREETQECEAPCESGEEEMHICPNIIWGPWSTCNVTCGKGWKYRFRIPVQFEREEETDTQCTNKETVECYEEDC